MSGGVDGVQQGSEVPGASGLLHFPREAHGGGAAASTLRVTVVPGSVVRVEVLQPLGISGGEVSM